ncbi:hypothetical protein HMPREF0083_04849 [Aneurinibacillus aneurinilyticus ATCC 12856]|uniref:Uncharacterized protein n=1 Tax=Aneurinibacillus aneurinilyticus ATCC 12856 TaxID=649747 RepID=U1WES1_ANEAE|nr:hypothetical protein HMPREF0083_04849 [Aneurinibacillus aneurinilyticus ATCC 12856]
MFSYAIKHRGKMAGDSILHLIPCLLPLICFMFGCIIERHYFFVATDENRKDR